MRLILVLRIEPGDQTCKSSSLSSASEIVYKEILANLRTVGTIAMPILWGILEISVGVVSACIPSLMPLFLVILGKRRHIERRVLYVEYGEKSRSNQPNKFNRMVDLGSPGPLPEGLEIPPFKSNRRNDSDDLGLMRGRYYTGNILVTNQIEQISEPTSRGEEESQRPVEQGTAQPLDWEIRRPPQPHFTSQWSKV